MKKIVFIAICLFGLTVAAHAQFTVNGMVPGNMYTLEQMKAAFGNNPSHEITSVSDDLGTTYSLEYGDDYFSFSTEWGWSNFTLETNAYPVVMDNVTFRVGDNISFYLQYLIVKWSCKNPEYTVFAMIPTRMIGSG